MTENIRHLQNQVAGDLRYVVTHNQYDWGGIKNIPEIQGAVEIIERIINNGDPLRAGEIPIIQGIAEPLNNHGFQRLRKEFQKTETFLTELAKAFDSHPMTVFVRANAEKIAMVWADRALQSSENLLEKINPLGGSEFASLLNNFKEKAYRRFHLDPDALEAALANPLKLLGLKAITEDLRQVAQAMKDCNKPTSGQFFNQAAMDYQEKVIPVLTLSRSISRSP